MPLDSEVLEIMTKHDSMYKLILIMKQKTERLENIKQRFEEELIKKKMKELEIV